MPELEVYAEVHLTEVQFRYIQELLHPGVFMQIPVAQETFATLRTATRIIK